MSTAWQLQHTRQDRRDVGVGIDVVAGPLSWESFESGLSNMSAAGLDNDLELEDLKRSVKQWGHIKNGATVTYPPRTSVRSVSY